MSRGRADRLRSLRPLREASGILARAAERRALQQPDYRAATGDLQELTCFAALFSHAADEFDCRDIRITRRRGLQKMPATYPRRACRTRFPIPLALRANMAGNGVALDQTGRFATKYLTCAGII